MLSEPPSLIVAMWMSVSRISTSPSPSISRARDFARAFLADRKRFRPAAVQLERHLLEIQNHVGRIFDHAFDRRKFVLDALDLDGRDRRTFDRRKQGPADRIADRRAEAALERLCVKFAVPFGQRFGLDIQPARHLKICPIIALCHICSF